MPRHIEKGQMQKAKAQTSLRILYVTTGAKRLLAFAHRLES